MSTLDLDSIILAGEYAIDSSVTVINGPSFTGDATLIVALPVSAVASDVQQTLFSQDDQGYIRTRNAGIWGNWGLINPGSGGGGTVTNVSGANANGFNVVVTNPTTIPAIAVSLNNNTPTVVTVSNDGGNDLTADGTIALPFATISAANAFITDASNAKPYMIYVTPGIYTDTDFSPKPDVTLELNGSSYTVTNLITLDPSWNGSSGTLNIQNGFSIAFMGGMNLDFDALGVTSAILQLTNIITSTNSLFTINGSTIGGTVAILQGVEGFALQPDITINNCYGAIEGGAPINLIINHTSETTGGNFTITNVIELGSFSVNDSTTAGFTLFLTDNKVVNNATFTSTGAGQFAIFERGCVYINPIILSGANIAYYPETITNLPTLMSGATFTPSSIANGINANYPSPTNYTPIDPSVNGHLQGIDNALGTISATNQYAFMMNQVNALPNGIDNITFDPGTFEASSGLTLLGDNQTIQVANNIKGFFTLQLQLTSNITTDTINFVLNVTSGDGTVTSNSLNLINLNYYTSSVSWFVDSTGTTPAQFQVGFNNSAVSGDMDLSSQTSLIFQGL